MRVISFLKKLELLWHSKLRQDHHKHRKALVLSAVLERTRTVENDITVKRIAKNYLGHLYDKENNQIKELAIDEAQDGDVVLEDPKMTVCSIIWCNK